MKSFKTELFLLVYLDTVSYVLFFSMLAVIWDIVFLMNGLVAKASSFGYWVEACVEIFFFSLCKISDFGAKLERTELRLVRVL